MLAGYSFRPRLWALALALAACAAGVALGNWQSRRADEKRALGAQVQRIKVAGEFLAERTVLLDNKLRAHRAGYEVVTPLRLADGIFVLVNRGWFERGAKEPAAPAGQVRIEGLVRARLPHALRLGEESKSRVRQNVEIAEFAKETGLPLQPFVIEQHSDTGDGLVRDWPRPEAGAEKNEAYSFQWYSLAGLAVVIFIVLSFRKHESAQ